jgi:hypothetical protein
MKKAKPVSEPSVRIAVGDPAHLRGEFKRMGGSQSDDWNNRIVTDTAAALWLKNSDETTKVSQMTGAIAALVGIGPKDELEGMMGAQLIASHSAAMECYRRAMIGEQTFVGRQENLNHANKLSRTFTMLLDALNRHRGKGQQKVTVEHVHVHAGGQAIVGAVDTPGGGMRPGTEEQPHAKQITHAPEQAMRCEDPEPESVPVGGDGERTLPAARRPVARRSEG